MKSCDVDIQIQVFFSKLLTIICWLWFYQKNFQFWGGRGGGEEFSPPFIGVPGLIIFYHFIICNLAPYDNFSSLSSFKKFLRATYFTLLDTTHNIDMPCTWFLSRNCPCHRS